MKYGVIKLYIETHTEEFVNKDLVSMKEAEEIAQELRWNNSDSSITYYACSHK